MTEPRRLDTSALLAKVQLLRTKAPVVDSEPEPDPALAELEQLQAKWLRVCPPRFHDARLQEVREPDLTSVREWLNRAFARTAGNLVLTGPVGTGKTFCALALARELFFARHSVVFAPVIDMLDELRPGGDGQITTYMEPRLLILDDLGGERPTDWTIERLFRVINHRWLKQTPTLCTTNLSPARLRAAIGGRAYDRLRDEAVALEVGGTSRRAPRMSA